MQSKVAVLAVIVGCAGMGLFVLPVRDWLVTALTWIQELGPLGPLAVMALYILCSVSVLPVFALSIGSGFVFKFAAGLVTVSVGSTLGACAAFLVGRTVGRNWVEQKLGGHPRLKAIDAAVSRKGFTVALLTRLSPAMPFNIFNYALSLTRIPFWKYALASWLGMLPTLVLYVYIGAGLGSLAQVKAGEVETGAAGKYLFVFGIAATAVLTVVITAIAGRTLKDIAPDDPE